MADQKLTALTADTTPLDSDITYGVKDPAGTPFSIKWSWTTVKAFLKTYFDGLYPSGSGTSSGTNTGDNATNTQYSGLAASKQDTLVSTTNIKTVNGTSLLGAGDLVVSGGGGGITWTALTVDATLAVNTGNLANKATLLTLTLPSVSAVGAVIRVAGMNAGLFKIAQLAGQSINFGNQVTTTGIGGSINSVLTYDSVELVCKVANTSWMVVSSVGNLTII